MGVDSQWNGHKLTARLKAAGRRGTRAAGTRLRALALPLTPLDRGPLRKAASVKGVNQEPVALVVFDSPYAVRQHEELDYNHTVGQAKYLEQPLNQHRNELMGIIAQHMREAIDSE